MCSDAKFNNNAGAVLGGRAAQAFSHFTVHESSKQLCICDLQGVGGSLFTDPQIHSTSGSYGDGNLGPQGISSFLSTHRCNSVCAALKLPEVAAKRRAPSGTMGGGEMGMPGGAMPAGAGDIQRMMRGHMGGAAGMTQPMQRIMEKMMKEMMHGKGPDRAQRGNLLVNGNPVHGGREGGGGGARWGVGDTDELKAAVRASEKAAAEEEHRNVRAAIAASSLDGARGGRGSGGGGGQRRR